MVLSAHTLGAGSRHHIGPGHRGRRHPRHPRTTPNLAVGVLARSVLRTRPSAARAVTRVSGAMMIVIGGFLLVERLAG